MPKETKTIRPELPKYHGWIWVRNSLPEKAEAWHQGKKYSLGKHLLEQGMKGVLERTAKHGPWVWPKRPVFFVTDPHADAEAFVASLVASGGVWKTGRKINSFKLTKEGRKARFILGGDCLDKGPSSLKLLRSIRRLRDKGAKVKMLAGNHDLRLLMGLRTMGAKRDPRTEHMFVRMGPKVVPLFKELHGEYFKARHKLKGVPGNRACRRKLFPSESWFDEFPKAAEHSMSAAAIEREMVRMRKKVDRFEDICSDAGLTLRDVYATAQKCQQLFLKRKGEFSWLFRDMRLLHQEGSFLFIHAGFDDRLGKLFKKKGIKHLNRLFRKQIKHDLFEFYYGPLANAMRTKYRDCDLPLTGAGVEAIYRRGVNVIVHGHKNRIHGQKIALRQGMLHIESDITMDRNSRKKEGLDGYGAGVTIIRPERQVIGISTDYPHAKVFLPDSHISGL